MKIYIDGKFLPKEEAKKCVSICAFVYATFFLRLTYLYRGCVADSKALEQQKY